MPPPIAWRSHLSSSEDHALQETEAWLAAAQSKKKTILSYIEKPLAHAYAKVPLSVQDAVTNTVASALEKMRQGSAWMVSRDTVHDKLRQRVGPFQGSLELLGLPVQQLDVVAREYVDSARMGLTIEGAAAGTSGLIGLAADIPILYCTLFKVIQEVAFCYGFPVKPLQEKAHILKVLDVGHDLRGMQRLHGMMQLFQMQELIREGIPAEALEAFEPRSGTQTQALVRNLRLARQLAMDLIERKLLQSLVVVGGFIGAASNYRLSTDVGTVAWHSYRRRFLMEVGIRRELRAVARSFLPTPVSRPSG